MDDQAILALCHRFLDTIETGDIEALREVYAPDVAVWHNTDDLEQTLDQNLAQLKGVVENLTDRRYADRRISAFAGGFVEQHVLLGRFPDGSAFRLPACLVCKVTDGRISRIDEYLDFATIQKQAPRSA